MKKQIPDGNTKLEEDKMNEQEQFWAEEFGDEYLSRNMSQELLAANMNLFSKIFQRTSIPGSVLELGCNLGMNLKAISSLMPKGELIGVDINKSALELLKKNLTKVTSYEKSISEPLDIKAEFVFAKGVLIHINPDDLGKVYHNLYACSERYICIAEYYSPTPVVVDYRGYNNRLFKRDFCGELMRKYPELNLIDYGFCYHLDTAFPQDDINWFLLEK